MRSYPPADPALQDAVAQALADLLATAPFVDFAFGHGSFFTSLPSHDIDVALGLAVGAVADLYALHDLASRCEGAVGRPVDVHVLGTPDSPLASTATTGRVLYARDADAALAFAERAALMAWDFRWLQGEAVRDLAAAGRDRRARRAGSR